MTTLDNLVTHRLLKKYHDVREKAIRAIYLLDKLTDAIFYYEEEYGFQEERTRKTQDLMETYKLAVEAVFKLEDEIEKVNHRRESERS